MTGDSAREAISMQTSFWKRNRYVIRGNTRTEKTHRARIEQLLDEYWVYGPTLVTDGMRSEIWTVEANEGFAEAVRSEGPRWATVAIIEENVGPDWHRCAFGGGCCA